MNETVTRMVNVLQFWNKFVIKLIKAISYFQQNEALLGGSNASFTQILMQVIIWDVITSATGIKSISAKVGLQN